MLDLTEDPPLSASRAGVPSSATFRAGLRVLDRAPATHPRVHALSCLDDLRQVVHALERRAGSGRTTHDTMTTGCAIAAVAAALTSRYRPAKRAGPSSKGTTDAVDRSQDVHRSSPPEYSRSSWRRQPPTRKARTRGPRASARCSKRKRWRRPRRFPTGFSSSGRTSSATRRSARSFSRWLRTAPAPVETSTGVPRLAVTTCRPVGRVASTDGTKVPVRAPGAPLGWGIPSAEWPCGLAVAAMRWSPSTSNTRRTRFPIRVGGLP